LAEAEPPAVLQQTLLSVVLALEGKKPTYRRLTYPASRYLDKRGSLPHGTSSLYWTRGTARTKERS